MPEHSEISLNLTHRIISQVLVKLIQSSAIAGLPVCQVPLNGAELLLCCLADLGGLAGLRSLVALSFQDLQSPQPAACNNINSQRLNGQRI